MPVRLPPRLLGRRIGREAPEWDTHLRSFGERTVEAGPLRGIRGAMRARPDGAQGPTDAERSEATQCSATSPTSW